MKKWITLALLVCFVFVFVFYFENKITNENSGDKKQINQSSNEIDNNISKKEAETDEYNSALELLYKGKMDDIEFGIGTNSMDIIKQWGEPNQKANFMGGLLLSYDEISFLTDGFILNEKITYGNVIGIYYAGEEAIYGIKKGMTLEQVEKILGSPNDTYISQHSELYTDDHVIVKYIAGKYVANVEIDNESEKVNSISIWQKEE